MYRKTREELENERELLTCMSVCTLVSLALFFGLLFGLNYPEIRLFDYTPTTCTALFTTIIPRYCCEKSCGGCHSAPPYAETCADTINAYHNLDPTKCSPNVTNSCPVNGYQCKNGYHCCATVCSTCRSCTTTDKVTRCHNYACNCFCASSVSNRECTVSCGQCHTANLYLSYLLANGTELKELQTRDFGRDRDGAAAWLATYNNTSFKCYYNPESSKELQIQDPSYTPWKWAITAIFGILPLTIALIFWCCYVSEVIRNRIPEAEVPPPDLEAEPVAQAVAQTYPVAEFVPEGNLEKKSIGDIVAL